jgi:hypothetical protein
VEGSLPGVFPKLSGREFVLKICVRHFSTIVFLLVFAVAPCLADTAISKVPDQTMSKETPGEVDFGDYGRVGINTKSPATTLDVHQGEIKIGSTGAACTAALAGALRYADKYLQLCNGTSWRNVSLEKVE